jgi:hypothetical protein
VSADGGNQEQERRDQLADDYARTVEVFALLADIRFKLLAFVPSIVGATIALVSRESDQRVILAVALLGFVATLGILLYELRNSELYNAASHRASVIEGELGLIRAVPTRTRHWLEGRAKKSESWPKQGGIFSERPYVPKAGEPGFRLFGVMTVKHDRALALVYGAAMGGWAYLLADSSLRLAHVGKWAAFPPSLGTAVVVALAVLYEVNRHDRSRQMQTWRTP